jgi:hypothetical protein
MQLQTRLQKKIIAILTLISLLTISILFSCGDKRESDQFAPATDQPESFTFFELGTNTKLTERIRKDLGKKLGRDAIEHRSILNLETNYEGFIQKYLPDIYKLNSKINFPPGERVEHNTVKLMYRYAGKKDAPFDYVELVFSKYTNTPLVFKINFKKDETGIVETLKSKYGPPQVINWQEESGRSMIWEKSGDTMIVSQVPDQFGRHGYQIVIYFARNLKKLIDIEQTEKAERERQKASAGKTAF